MSTSSLLALPPEIILRIVECSPPSSLKILRQSCSTLQKMTEPLLFHTVAVYPHMHRVEQVLNMSLQPRLKQHVKAFVYDNRYIGLVDFIIKKIESTYSARVSSEDKVAMLGRARKFKKSTLEPSRDEDIELLFLHDIIRNLPNLESVTCRENRTFGMSDDVSAIKELPDLYSELRSTTCGLHADFDFRLDDYSTHACSKLKQTAARILVASARAPPGRVNSFKIENGIWESITNFEPEGKHITMLTPFIAKLHTLEISADHDDDHRREFLMTNLGSVLDLAVSLTSLHLNFGVSGGDPYTITDSDPEDPPAKSTLNCILRSSICGSWPERLHSLSLGYVTCYRPDFSRLLRQCKHNLKHLSLSDFSVLPPFCLVRDDRQPECLVAIMHEIKEQLHLESVQLSSMFSNTMAQVWTVVPQSSDCQRDRDTTASRLEKFILNGGDCPIDSLAIQPNERDVTEEQLDANWHLGDDSFVVRRDWFMEREGMHQAASGSSDDFSPGLIAQLGGSILALHDEPFDTEYLDTENQVAPWPEPHIEL